MAFVSIHTMDGDPEELLHRKEAAIDPVVDEFATACGALLSITGGAPEPRGCSAPSLQRRT